MAQFVTHIQPTLMEASHHHVPHPHHHKEASKEHTSKDHRPKEHHHPKEHTTKDHGKDHHHHKDSLDLFHVKALRHSSPPFPVLPHGHHDSHHDLNARMVELQVDQKESGLYLDSHGLPHSYHMKFIDSQGIYRDYHGHGIDGVEYRNEELLEKERKNQEMKIAVEEAKAVPPKYIELNPVHTENKGVSFFLR